MTPPALLCAVLALCASAALPERCLVCGETLSGAGDTLLRHRGREVTICARPPCLPAWQADPERFFQRVQARSALFDEEAAGDRQVSLAWIVLGACVLLAVVGGAVWGCLAVGRKAPLTHAPRSCPRCGAAVHPAAPRCAACGAELQAVVEAETARA